MEYAEPNYTYRALEVLPNDPEFGNQWALTKMNLPRAWQFTTGREDLTVAVIDTGADLAHPELASRLLGGYDFVNLDASPRDDSPDGHGTAVAGIIAAATDNSYGLAGRTWKGKVLPLKALDQNGEGYVSDIAAAIEHAADNGARVINLSLGGAEDSFVLRDAINYALGKGVVVVAAAGNEGVGRVCYPAAYPGVIAAGAVASNDTRPSFSNYGPDLDVVAPGKDILVLQRGGVWALGSGTSFAAPHVSALAALMLALDPEAPPPVVQHLLASSAVDLGIRGRDDYYGYGRADAFRAQQMLLGDLNSDGIVDVYDLVLAGRGLGPNNFFWQYI